MPQNGDDLVYTFTTGNGNAVFIFLTYSTLSLNSLTCNATGAGPITPIGNLLTLGTGGITVNAGASPMNIGMSLAQSANQT